MAWPKTLTRTVAVPRNSSVTPETRWCLAESVWRYAADNDLSVLSFREVDPRRVDEIPRSVRQFGVDRDEFDWHVFEAVVTRA